MSAEAWSSDECRESHDLFQKLAAAALKKRAGQHISGDIERLRVWVSNSGHDNLKVLFLWMQQNCPELVGPEEKFDDMDWSDLW